MNRGIYRNVVAGLMFAICLVMAVPQSAEAGLLEPSHHEQTEGMNVLQQEITIWEAFWNSLESMWGRVSVMIDPHG